VLNLAIGTFSVIAVLVATWLVGEVGLVASAIAGLVAVGALGLVVDRTLLTPAYRSTGEQRILLGIFTTLGLTVFLDGFLLNGLELFTLGNFTVFPGFPFSYTLPLELPRVSLGDAVVQTSSLVVILVGSTVLVILFAFLDRTFLGKATRTVFQDETGAQLVGVHPRRIRTLIFVLSVTVAGLAGLLWGLGHNVSVSSAFRYTTFGLIVSIVGGVRSLTGAIAAGLLLGLVNTFASYYIGTYVATVILFAAAIVFLLAKPEALS
jgi:branched-chain amino acid transport system permease protein